MIMKQWKVPHWGTSPDFLEQRNTHTDLTYNVIMSFQRVKSFFKSGDTKIDKIKMEKIPDDAEHFILGKLCSVVNL